MKNLEKDFESLNLAQVVTSAIEEAFGKDDSQNTGKSLFAFLGLVLLFGSIVIGIKMFLKVLGPLGG